MSASNRIGWATLLALAVLGFALAIAARCKAEPRSLVDRLVTAQGPLQSRAEAPVDARELAEAIAAIPRVNQPWAALVLTIAAHESALSARIARGECKRLECDGGRAAGLYQAHKNTINAAVWGSPDIRIQTLEAARALRSAYYTCNRGPVKPDWVRTTINAYAGRACDAIWPGLEARVATFQRVSRAL